MAVKYTEEQLNNTDHSLLVQLLISEREENIRLTEQIESLTASVNALNEKMQTMMEQLILSQKNRFGRSSEKMEIPGQISSLQRSKLMNTM